MSVSPSCTFFLVLFCFALIQGKIISIYSLDTGVWWITWEETKICARRRNGTCMSMQILWCHCLPGRGGKIAEQANNCLCLLANSIHLPSGAFHGPLLSQICLGSVEERKLDRRRASASCQDNELEEIGEAEREPAAQWSSAWGDVDEVCLSRAACCSL